MASRHALVWPLIVISLVLGCDDEEIVGGCDPCPPAYTLQPLTQRWHVLNNLQLAYNDRDMVPLDQMLDVNFVFHFAPGDVRGGIPAQWGRAEETAATMMLFDRYLAVPGFPACRSIRMDLKYENGLAWADTMPPAFPGETWQTTRVFYEFTIEIEPDETYIAVPGASMQVMVRNIGTTDAPQWRLVEWRDLGDGAIVVQGPASTNETTWGSIKGLYYAGE
jgi:hypothetical protein